MEWGLPLRIVSIPLERTFPRHTAVRGHDVVHDRARREERARPGARALDGARGRIVWGFLITVPDHVAPPQRMTQAIIICQLQPVLRGEGDVDYLCGFCDAVIVEAVGRGQLQQHAFKCPTCVRYGEQIV